MADDDQVTFASQTPEDFLRPLQKILAARADLEHLYELAKTSTIPEVRSLALLMDKHETDIWFALVELDQLFVDEHHNETALLNHPLRERTT